MGGLRGSSEVVLLFFGGVLGYEVAFRGGLRGSSEVPTFWRGFGL